MRIYCLPSDELAVSICKKSPQSENSSFVQLHVRGNRKITKAYHHLHTNAAVDSIHEHIEFVETTDRTSDRLPHRQQETDRGKRFLATTERARIFVAIAFLRADMLFLSSDLDVENVNTMSSGGVKDQEIEMYIYLELQRLICMVEHDLAVVAAVGKMVLEHDLAPKRDVAPEVVPFIQANLQRRLQSLCVR